MVTKINPSYMKRSYQLLAKLTPVDISTERAFEQASNIIYIWARVKFSSIFNRIPMDKKTYEDKRDGNEFGVIYDHNAKLFILRCSHPDAQIPGRIWTTDVEIRFADNVPWLAVRLSVTSLNNTENDVPLSTPQFIKNIIDNIGITDVVEITAQPTTLVSNTQIDHFIEFLEADSRRFPIVLLTQCRGMHTEYNSYMLDPIQLSKQLSGVAHVYLLPKEFDRYFSECVGIEWAAFNGAIRTYYPSLDFDESNIYSHPLLTQTNLTIRKQESCDDTDIVSNLVEYVKRFSAGQKIAWEDVNIRFYLLEHQNLLSQERNTRTQDYEGLTVSYELQLCQMRQEKEEAMALAQSFADDIDACQRDNNDLREQFGKLKIKTAALRHKISELSATDDCQDVPLGTKYSEISDWIGTHFPDRLMLHARAKRSLKSACYSDIQLVYNVLKLLATDYYEYRTGVEDLCTWTAAYKAIDPSLEAGHAISDVSAGMQGDEYYVHYEGRKQKLEYHITKGTSKDQRYCLRIYFFWDDERQLVVIGDMPHHLNTTAT